MSDDCYVRYFQYNRQSREYEEITGHAMDSMDWHPWELDIPEKTSYISVSRSKDSTVPLSRIHLVSHIFNQERASHYHESLARHMADKNIKYAFFLGNGANRVFLPEPHKHMYVIGTKTEFIVPPSLDLEMYVNDRVPADTYDEDEELSSKEPETAREEERPRLPDIRERIEPQIVPVVPDDDKTNRRTPPPYGPWIKIP